MVEEKEWQKINWKPDKKANIVLSLRRAIKCSGMLKYLMLRIFAFISIHENNPQNVYSKIYKATNELV